MLCGQYAAITLAYLQIHVFTGIREVMQQSWLHGGTPVHRGQVSGAGNEPHVPTRGSNVCTRDQN